MTHSANRLDPSFWKALEPMKSVREYAAGITLFERGMPAQGIYFIEQGRVRILLDRTAGKLFEVAGPGAILALAESVSGNNYKSTAEAADRVIVAFVQRRDFIDFLREHCEVCMQIVQLLSENLHVLYHEVQGLELPVSRHRRKSRQKLN